MADVRAEQATWTGLRVDSVEFTGCDLSSLRLADSRLTRVRFTDCKLLGATLQEVTAEHVVFDRCKLDYATFGRLRAKGPVIFTGTALREAQFNGCDLHAGAFDDCRLELAEFGGGGYRGCDLRGNDLSLLRGVLNLEGIRLERTQLLQLAAAVSVDLDLIVTDDDGVDP